MPDKKKKVDRTKINPQVKDIYIGVRTLRKIKIYPLSVADQLELTDMLTEAIGAFFSIGADGKLDEGPPIEFVAFILKLLKENIGDIITKITGIEDSDSILSDITNDQMSDIVSIVYEENFEGPLKKVVGLFQKEDEETRMESILAKLQPQSAGPTADTDSNTSSNSATGKEESL